ncbi:hypothetical protein QA601_16990 [Chitinispirillales bacterium ANBcel5]|uniref:hypothetical protein n=1 Tax=Cellulosispirillum alkaliphilum TaxID=3039283 RepID=UPI002A4F126E|nr:hypothetical protein [Chitinispirillales bacterium ANBcel5]
MVKKENNNASSKLSSYFVYKIGLIFLTLLLFPQGAKALCSPKILNNEDILNEFGIRVGRSVELGVEYALCLDTTYEKPVLLLFRNGTQYKVISEDKSKRFTEQYPKFFDTPAGFDTRKEPSTPEDSDLRPVWDTLFDSQIDLQTRLHRMLDFGSWETGLFVSYQLESVGSRINVIRNSLKWDVMTSFLYFYIGAGFGHYWHRGHTTDHLKELNKNRYYRSTFSLSLGVPFVRYEMKRLSTILPQYFWLESDITEIMDGEVESSALTLNSWELDTQNRVNFVHNFHFKFSKFGVVMTIDKDNYLYPVLKFSINDLPTGFGTWGATLVKSGNVYIPGVTIDMPQLGTTFFSGSDYEIPISLDVFRLHFNYIDLNRYNIGLKARLRLNLKRDGQELL